MDGETDGQRYGWILGKQRTAYICAKAVKKAVRDVFAGATTAAAVVAAAVVAAAAASFPELRNDLGSTNSASAQP